VAAALASDPLYQPNKHDDLWIERFLLSHKRNVTEGIKAAPYTLQFRTKHKLDEVDICYSPIGPNCELFQKFHDYCSGDTFVVMCCVMMEVLPDDVTPSHDVSYTTEQCHDSPRSGSPQRPQGPAWIDKLPIEMLSKDNELAILLALQEDEDREWDAGWREVPDRYRERRRKRKQSVKPK
jgi:hypothetical protein